MAKEMDKLALEVPPAIAGLADDAVSIAARLVHPKSAEKTGKSGQVPPKIKEKLTDKVASELLARMR